MLMFKTLAALGLFASVGAAVGYSKILCVNGDCPITGSSYGGALLGAVLGMAVISGFSNKTPLPPSQDDQDGAQS